MWLGETVHAFLSKCLLLPPRGFLHSFFITKSCCCCLRLLLLLLLDILLGCNNIGCCCNLVVDDRLMAPAAVWQLDVVQDCPSAWTFAHRGHPFLDCRHAVVVMHAAKVEETSLRRPPLPRRVSPRSYLGRIPPTIPHLSGCCIHTGTG